jgi:Tfp pilus assembly protein PilF
MAQIAVEREKPVPECGFGYEVPRVALWQPHKSQFKEPEKSRYNRLVDRKGIQNGVGMTGTSEELYKRALSEMKKEKWVAAIALLESASVQTNWRIFWNLGWCYFKLNEFDDAKKQMIRAARLAPENATCKWGLGTVYLQTRHFKKAEIVLTESLTIKESHLTRIALAMAYLSQGKVSQAENVHLEGIRRKPKSGERYESYAAFLSDVGRETEAQRINRKAKRLRSIN